MTLVKCSNTTRSRSGRAMRNHRRKQMALRGKYLTGCAGLVLAAMMSSPGFAVDPSRLLSADQNANDWLTNHGSYKSYHYSPADQINAGNVKNLEVAWTHFPERATRGIQSTPLAADGVLYYSGSYSRVIALDMKTGKPVWDTRLVDSKKLTVGFTGAPLAVKDTVIIGSQGGEWPGRGPIFGVDGKSGQKKWEFFTVAGTDEAKATWGGESWRTGGGGGWMAGAYDPETNTVWWGTGNPAPLYDWAGADWQKSGPRPGTNLYTTSVIGLDPDTGKLKFYHQERPHDAWDFASSVGEFLSIDRGGEKLREHPNKGCFIVVYDRANGRLDNVWQLTKNINFVKGIDPKTGELIGRRDLSLGKADTPLCPAIAGGISWNSGAYSPKTQLYYKISQEWCMDITVIRTRPILEPMAQLNIGADFKLVAPPDGPARGRLDARDPVTGAKKWEINYKQPPLASILATGGNLLFVPDSEGVVHAYNAETGQELWSHGNGMGHNAGIISYMAGGKQYIAVPAGWGSLVSDEFAALWGEPFKSMAKNTGALFVFALKQ